MLSAETKKNWRSRNLAIANSFLSYSFGRYRKDLDLSGERELYCPCRSKNTSIDYVVPMMDESIVSEIAKLEEASTKSLLHVYSSGSEGLSTKDLEQKLKCNNSTASVYLLNLLDEKRGKVSRPLIRREKHGAVFRHYLHDDVTLDILREGIERQGRVFEQYLDVLALSPPSIGSLVISNPQERLPFSQEGEDPILLMMKLLEEALDRIQHLESEVTALKKIKPDEQIAQAHRLYLEKIQKIRSRKSTGTQP